MNETLLEEAKQLLANYGYLSNVEALNQLQAEYTKLHALVHTPQTHEWLEAVPLEAAYQIERWGTSHDQGKEPQDWFWLLGWLAGKAVHAAMSGDSEKAKHHTVSSAAVLLNWHRHLSGEDTTFRPGIAEPEHKHAYENGLSEPCSNGCGLRAHEVNFIVE